LLSYLSGAPSIFPGRPSPPNFGGIICQILSWWWGLLLGYLL